jgi:hypothetical protein
MEPSKAKKEGMSSSWRSPSPPPPSYRLLGRNIPLLSISAAVTSTVLLTWSPVAALLLRQRGATSADVALTFAALNLVNAVALYVGGAVADRWGGKRVITFVGWTVGVVWLLMAAWGGSWPAFASLYVLANGLFGFQGTSFVTMVSDSTEPSHRAAAFAYFQLWSAVSLIAGPLLGTLVVLPHIPDRFYLGATGLAYLLAGAVRGRWLVEPRRVTASWKGMGNILDPRHLWRAATATASRQRLLLLTMGVTLAFALSVNGPFLALVAHVQDGIHVRLVDLLFAIGPVGALIAGAMARRSTLGLPELLALGLSVHALGDLAFLFPMGLGALVGVFLVLFSGFQVATIAFSSLRVSLASDRETGTVLGATSALAGVVTAVGVSLAGAMGPQWALVLAAVVSVATGVGYLALHRREASSRHVPRPAAPSVGAPGNG